MHKVNQDTYARAFKLLLQDPATAHEIAEETGLHVVTSQNLMRCLKKHKVVHISAWDVDKLGRDCTPVYKLGNGKNVGRRRVTDAERTKRYREKKKQLNIVNIGQQ